MLQVLRRQVWKHFKKHRRVNTWSPLATAFNSETRKTYEFDESKKDTGLFGNPQLKTPEGFNDLKHYAMFKVNNLETEIFSSSRRRKMVQIFDDISDTLCQVADLAEFIRIAHPEEEFVNAAENASISISSVVEKLNIHSRLYQRLKDAVNNDTVETTIMDKNVGVLFLFDFEQCGVHLKENHAKQVARLNDQLLQIGQMFMAGASQPRIIDVKTLPPGMQDYFPVQNNEAIVQGLYVNSSNSLVRETSYRQYLYPIKEQEQLLKVLLNKRHKLAELCGFPSYAHRAVKGSTVEKPEVIHQFLNILKDELKEKATQDYSEMKKMKEAELGGNQNVMPWDTAYYTGIAKKAWLNISTSEFTPYFSLGACMDGINILIQALYGIRLESVPILSGEVWANNIQKLAVMDENDAVLGYIYCDFFTRDRKPNQDCHFTIRGGRRLADGSYQNPIVVIMLSLPVPSWSNPCLLTPASVENLFHEMGHALHSMLGRTEYQHVSGTRCSTDFAEVPSILMEYFANDPRVVSTFAKHYKTMEKIPTSLLEKLSAAKNVFCASELQNQVFYSMLDQVYHSTDVKVKSTYQILEKVQTEYYGLPYVKNTAWHLRYTHLVGYGAKYYSYLLARAIAFCIWQTYFQENPFSRTAGDRYRNECLAHGGGKPASKLVSDFLNIKADASNFAKSLLDEINTRSERLQSLKT